MISFRPLAEKLAPRIGKPFADITEKCADTWEVSPGHQAYVPPAIFLPDQLHKIVDTEFGSHDDVVSAFTGDFDYQQQSTRGFRLRNVDLVDGVLYAPGRVRHLRTRQHKSIIYHRPRDVVSATMYESWIGNRWFGSWLGHDLLAHLVTETVPLPALTTAPPPDGHKPRYEELMKMDPLRQQSVHFDELILFDDFPNNDGKAARAYERRKRLINGRDVAPNPGVYILRGTTGDLRLLRNETEIAEKFAQEYGFAVINPIDMTVDEIVDACAGAQVVAGVEGSQLKHGMVVMPPKSTLFVIQPPDRVVATLKTDIDRGRQRYATIIGDGTQDGFTVDWQDIQRTMDMLAQDKHMR